MNVMLNGIEAMKEICGVVTVKTGQDEDGQVNPLPLLTKAGASQSTTIRPMPEAQHLRDCSADDIRDGAQKEIT
jgi:hypothetical protein